MSAGTGDLVALGLAQPALGDHAVEDVGDPAREVGLLLVTEGRVVERRRVDDRRQGGALRHGQLADVLVEVRLRRGLDAVGATAVVDRVEVVLEDLVLALLLVDLDGDDDLLELPGQRAVRREEVVLHVLLGDRRAAALDVGARAAPARPSGRCRSGRSRGWCRSRGPPPRARPSGRGPGPSRAAPTRGCPRPRRAGPARSCRRRSRRSRPGRWRGRWAGAAGSWRRRWRRPRPRARRG